MAHFNHPFSCFPVGVVFLLLNLFVSPLYMRNISFRNRGLTCSWIIIASISAEMLINLFREFNNDLIQHKFQLGYNMPICSGIDER